MTARSFRRTAQTIGFWPFVIGAYLYPAADWYILAFCGGLWAAWIMDAAVDGRLRRWHR